MEEDEGDTPLADFFSGVFPGWVSTIVLHGVGPPSHITLFTQAVRWSDVRSLPLKVSLSVVKRRVLAHNSATLGMRAWSQRIHVHFIGPHNLSLVCPSPVGTPHNKGYNKAQWGVHPEGV